MYLFIQMSSGKNKSKSFKARKQPFPVILRNFILIAALVIVAIVISAVFYFQATVLALIALCIAKLLFVGRADLTFLEDEYDLDIPVEERVNQEKNK
jgi:hypothetical protein